MRQIHICAWLLAASSVVVACSGDKFTSSPEGGPHQESPPAPNAGGSGSKSGASAGKSNSTSEPSEAGRSAQGGGSGGGAKSVGGSGPTSSSSGTSSGAHSSNGGSGGSTDDTGAGGEPSPACPSGTITFRMLPGPDLRPDYLCDAGCGTGWLTVTDAEGATAFSIFSACGTASCESCETLGCAVAACVPRPLTAEGSELVWTGTYLAKGTCGANLACQRQACVKPGKYKAKACAAISGEPAAGGACTPQSEQLCAEVEFDFPATATVKLVLKK